MADVGQMDLPGIKADKDTTPDALAKDGSSASSASPAGGINVAVRQVSRDLTDGTPDRKRKSADESSDDEEEDSEGNDAVLKSGEKKSGRRKINIEFIEDKSRRHITFSKRKAGIMKKAYELSTLTGTQVLLLVASETGHVYTFATPKLQPLITKSEGKNLIQACLNSPDSSIQPVGRLYDTASDQLSGGSSQSVPQVISTHHDSMHLAPNAYQSSAGSIPYPQQTFNYQNLMSMSGITPNYMSSSVPTQYGSPAIPNYNQSYVSPHHGSVQPKK